MGHLTTTAHPYAFFEGKVVKVEDAKVSIMTNALQYGTGVFGGLRGYYNKEQGSISIFRLDDHIKRFYQSFRILGVELRISPEEAKQAVIELMEKNNPTVDTYIRIFGYADSLNLAPNLARESQFGYFVYMVPLSDYLATDKGLSVMVSSWRRLADNAIPSRAKISGSYVNAALAKQQAIQLGFDEAIYLNESGHVSEGSAMNIAIVRDGTIITPAVTDDILEGITIRSVLKVAEDMGIPVVTRSIDRSELYIADEAFFTGTAAQIAWIARVDGRTVGDGTQGPITRKLQESFFKIIRGNDPEYDAWCTKVAIEQY
ncbi:MAG: branched-chain amino acid transaminase [Patescibacteria group bacterium]